MDQSRLRFAIGAAIAGIAVIGIVAYMTADAEGEVCSPLNPQPT
jgi:hypothetical protein